MNNYEIPSKRALFVLPADIIGGAERLTATLAETAAESGLFEQIDIFVLSKPPTGSLAHLETRTNITITHTHAVREPVGIMSFIRFLWGKQFDFVFSTHTHVNALCCTLRRFGILKTDRFATRESTLIFEKDCGKFNLIIPYLVRMYGSQDILLHQTERMRRSFNRNTNRRLERKCHCLPNPVNVELIRQNATKSIESRLGLKPDNIYIAWCGYLVPRKNPLLAIEALQNVHESGKSNTHLIFIGDGPLLANARDKAETMGLADHIVFAGHQENPWAIMAQCDVGLLTSQMEGFPNVLLEMLASGVRGVVTTNSAGDLDTVPGVKVCMDDSPQSLAALLIETLNQPPPLGIKQCLNSRTPAAYLQKLMSHDLVEKKSENRSGAASRAS